MSSILIVDDERNTVGLLALAVVQLGHEPLEACSGQQAIQCYVDHQPDMILLDQMMPGMDGIETLQEIRKLEGGCEVPIVILSAAKDFKLDDMATQAGATDYMSKPITLNELTDLLVRHLPA